MEIVDWLDAQGTAETHLALAHMALLIHGPTFLGGP